MSGRKNEKRKIFPVPSLQRLPPQLRVLLTKMDLFDLMGLAEHADDCGPTTSWRAWWQL
jgi:hypothetical protein